MHESPPDTGRAALERDIADLHQQVERQRRALSALYSVSLACRGRTSPRAIFEAVEREIRAIFACDACYIALCDAAPAQSFRAALMVDEGQAEYTEHIAYGELTGLLLRNRAPLLFEDLAAQRAALDVDPQSFGNVQKASRSWAGVPLQLGSDVLGVISIQSYRPGVYDAGDVDLLQRVADIVAVALENANLVQQGRELSAELAARFAERTGELATLGELAAELVLRRPLPDLMARALRLVVSLMGAGGGTVRRLSHDGAELVLLAQEGFPDSFVAFGARLPVEGSLVGRALRTNQALVIGEGASSTYWTGHGIAFESLLAVPLVVGERTVGALTLVDTAKRQFDERQVDLVRVIGNQLALAIENAGLLDDRERQVSELTALSQIAHMAGAALELPTLLRQVHAALAGFMRIDAFSMFVYDPQRRVIVEGIGIDEGEDYVFFRNQPPYPGSLTEWVINHRQTLSFRNLPEEIGQYPDLRLLQLGSTRHAASWIGTPLVGRDDQVIGTLAVQSYTVEAFTLRDERFLASVARQVALHVQNVSLLARRERQIRELNAIGRISRQIATSFDLDQMLREMYLTLESVTGASSFFVVVCEPETHRITHSFHIDGGEEVTVSWPDGLPPEGSLTAYIMRESEPLLFADLPAEGEELRRLGLRPRTYGSPDQPRSWAGVPLPAQDARPIGVIALQDGRPYQYDQQTLEFLAQVASHLSLGIQKVQLFAAEQEARRTADTLREVARALSSSFDPREVLQTILRELQRVIAYDTASVMLLDGQRLRTAALRGFDDMLAPANLVFHIHDRSGAGRAVALGRPVLIEDTNESPDWANNGSDNHVRSWLGVPLIAKGTVLGVLNIDARQPGRFTARDMTVAETFASQAAVALENARLYAESVARVEQELEIAHRIQSNLFPRTLPSVPGLQLAAQCLPARETGGDFYDCFVLGDPSEMLPDGYLEVPGTRPSGAEIDGPLLAIMVGDASGKSIPGAMLMAVARSIARSEARDHVAPPAVMRETNRWVSHDVPHGTFVALSYATLDPRTRRLAVASAGQLAPLLRRADGRLAYLQPPGPTLPLGINADVPYGQLEMTLSPGDTLVFYTDGVVEAHSPRGELFGFERLEALLAEAGDLPPETLIERVLLAVGEFAGHAPHHDDMTMVVVRVGAR